MELFWGLNDSELLYLISENNEVALELMYKKYEFYIAKVVSGFHTDREVREELRQEGLILLWKAIRKYNHSFGKTFLRYFDLMLRRRLFKVYKDSINYQIRMLESMRAIGSQQLCQPADKYESNKIIFKKKIDELIFREIIQGNRQIKSFCIQHNIQAKKVYNRIYYLKKITKV